MANTAATDIGDSVAAEVVDQKLVDTAYSAATADRLIAHDTLSGSLTKSYPRLGKLTAAALTDGTDGVATAVSDTQVSVTIAEVGIGVALTDLARVGSSVMDIARAIENLLAKAYANKVDVDVLALASSLTDAVSSTGNPLTEDMFLQAVMEIAANDAIGLGLACILYPKQWQNLTTAIGGVTENQSAVYSRPDFVEGFKPADVNGYVNTYSGIPIFVSTNVPTANAGADSRGSIFAIGEESPYVRCVGLLDGSEWDLRVERERDASLRAWEIWATGAYGVAVRAPDRGCGLVSVR